MAVYNNQEEPFQARTDGGQRLETLVKAMTRSLHMQESPLSTAFFNATNVDAIQVLVRDVIKRRTSYSIDRQSDDSLLAIMRYVYVQNSKNITNDIRGEVRRLNGLVVAEAAPIVASGMAQYLAYLRDASEIAPPLPRAQQTSIKGEKSTELFRGL